MSVKSFGVHNGDVVIEKTIQMVDGSELLRQKTELVIGTNKGEWAYDVDEGIDFHVVLRKNPNEDEIRATIEEALTRIDNTFAITEFGVGLKGRNATINFKAVNSDGQEVGGEYTYGS